MKAHSYVRDLCACRCMHVFCVYVCTRICVHAGVHKCVHTNMHACVHHVSLCVHACVLCGHNVSVLVHLHVCMCVCVHMYVCPMVLRLWIAQGQAGRSWEKRPNAKRSSSSCFWEQCRVHCTSEARLFHD